MCDGDSGPAANLPDWWSLSLYSFINEEFPLEGWVWEFMRRTRLREMLEDRPVDAMNPNPDLDSISPDFLNYYRPWNHSIWNQKSPTFLPPAAILPGRWPRGFAGQQYRTADEDERRMITVKIDINRRNSSILRDFRMILEDLRRETREPERVSPRTVDWVPNNILGVWDLRQFNVSWLSTARAVDIGRPDEDTRAAIQAARNSYNTARNYIEDGRWQDLARYIEPD